MNAAARSFWRRPARLRPPDEERHATWLELFFDLCFVAAVAALAAELHSDPSLGGLLKFAGLFVPVWWAWMGFTWYASAFDNDDAVFRLYMLAAMLAVVALAANVGGVDDGNSTGFVVSYAALKFLLAAMFVRARLHASEWRGFCDRYAASNALGAAVWLSSLAVSTPGRYWLWALGMAVLMTGPVIAVRSFEGIAFNQAHITERYGLFTIIVLGESIVVASTGIAELGGEASVLVAAAAGFGLAACIWWMYFEFVGSSALSRESLLSSFLWGYGHMFVFSGIAAAAVGVELVVEAASAGEPFAGDQRWTLALGLVAFLSAITVIHFVTVRAFDAVAIARAAAALVLLGLAMSELDAVAAIGAPLAVVVALVLFESQRAAAALEPAA
jgi:low temperature requirement protein LtrA